jgi:hypothetical protein
MDEQLDKDLKNRITEVFDNYEDPTADEGWELLRQRFPAPQAKRPVVRLWWYAAAAVILAVLTFGLWFNANQQDEQQFATKPKVTAPPAQPQDADSARGLSVPSAVAPQKNSERMAYQAPAQTPFTGLAETTVSPFSKQPSTTSTFSNTQAPATLSGDANPMPSNNQQVASIVPSQSNVTADSAKKAVVMGDAMKQPSVIAQTKPELTSDQKLQALFAQDAAKQKATESAEPVSKKIMFGVYAATYFNYAKGSTNEVNVGAGLSSDVHITKNLKFSTGVAIGQNTLAYNNAPPERPSRGDGKLYASAPAAAPVTNSTGFAANVSATPIFKAFNASLIALDIPLNLKYEFSAKKTDTYISAGLSSGTFVSERYQSVYNYVSPFSVSNQTEQEQTTNESFNNFYFAKTLNLSFGTGFSVGKSNRIVIEPFVKYPLSGMGSQQIKFGSGGINLKFNFNTGKK